MIDDRALAGSAGVRGSVPFGAGDAQLLLVHGRGDAGGVEDALAEVCGDLNHLLRSGYGLSSGMQNNPRASMPSREQQFR